VLLFEGIRDVFEEDQPEDDVLVLGCVHVAAQRIGGLPELIFETEVRGGVAVLVCHDRKRDLSSRGSAILRTK
jgi:hypothetical protein